ncbi:MAG: hypothetical protein ACLQDF_01980 [Desulfomonilia bacterium]
MNLAVADLNQLINVIWFQNSGPGQIFVLFILLIFIAAVISALHHTRRYRVYETQNLKTVEAKYDRIRGHSDTAGSADDKGEEDKKPISGMVDIDELRKGVPDGSVIGDRLKLLSQLRQAETKVNPVALQEMTRSREASRIWLSFPSFAVNLLLVVGLLGTFVGLAIMIQDISLDDLVMQNVSVGPNEAAAASQMDNQSGDRVEGLKKNLFVQLTGIMRGMRTKFSTTLVGLACAILCSFINLRLSHAQAAFFDRLDRFTTVDLLPGTIPAIEGETLMEKISLQLERNFSQLEDLAKRHKTVSQEINDIQKAFKDILDNVRQASKSEASGRLGDLLGQMATVIQQLGTVQLALKGLTEKLPTALEQIGKRIEKNAMRMESSANPVLQRSELPRWFMIWILSLLGFISSALVITMLKVF